MPRHRLPSPWPELVLVLTNREGLGIDLVPPSASRTDVTLPTSIASIPGIEPALTVNAQHCPRK
jgi:hypothetical protein